jgi:hypothetical protein
MLPVTQDTSWATNGPSGADDFKSLCIIVLYILYLKTAKFDSVGQSYNWETEISVVKNGLDHLQNHLDLLFQFILKRTSCNPTNNKLEPCYYEITTTTNTGLSKVKYYGNYDQYPSVARL